MPYGIIRVGMYAYVHSYIEYICVYPFSDFSGIILPEINVIVVCMLFIVNVLQRS